MSTYYKGMHGALVHLRDTCHDRHQYTGICHGIAPVLGRHQLPRVMRLWPEYSGTNHYPVPDVDGVMSGKPSPTQAMYYYAADNNLLYTGAYGEARLRLLDFLIDLYDNLAQFHGE